MATFARLAGLFSLMFVAGNAFSQSTTQLSITPPQPIDTAAFDVEVWFPTPQSPPAVQHRSVELDEATIRIRDCYREGVFAAVGFYRYTQTVGPLPAGTYQLEHWNAVCNDGELPPMADYVRQASLELVVIRGGGSIARPVNAFDRPAGIVFLALLLMILGVVRLQRLF